METTKSKSSILLKDIAKQQLSGNYKTVILAYITMNLTLNLPLQLLQKILNLNTTSGSAIYLSATVIITLLTAVFTLGQCQIYLKLARNQGCALSDMWYGFRNYADKAILANLIILLKTLAVSIPFLIFLCITAATKNYYIMPFAGLTCCFFIIAAVYIQLTYSQVFYFMLDYPEESAQELLNRSARAMKGNKLRLFYLQVSFLGLIILGVLSCGIGLFWVMPYMLMTKTEFYEDIKK